MGKYKGPKCKICRRNGVKLYLKGERCHTAKCEIEKRNFPPGKNASSFGRKISEYGRRLREKQKLRFFYGVSELGMRRYFKEAARQKGITGHNLLFLFERRLDNIVYRSGLANSRAEARQLVKHSHFKLNSKKANIPSILVRDGDTIEISEKSSAIFQPRFSAVKEKGSAAWLSLDEKSKSIKFMNAPKRDEIDAPVDEQLIVEFYSQ